MQVTNLSAQNLPQEYSDIYQASTFTIPFPVGTIKSCLKIASQGLPITKLQIHIWLHD